MKKNLKLYMVLLGSSPKGRLIEQHDIFFGIGTSVTDLAADMYNFWPDAGMLHIDSWREITHVDGYKITVVPKEQQQPADEKLFFINLGGYKPGELEEFHYKKLAVAQTMNDALKTSKKTTFFKHYTIKGPGASHIDDKYGLDVDDMYKVEDILDEKLRMAYSINITLAPDGFPEDELNIGYVKIGRKPV